MVTFSGSGGFFFHVMRIAYYHVTAAAGWQPTDIVSGMAGIADHFDDDALRNAHVYLIVWRLMAWLIRGKVVIPGVVLQYDMQCQVRRYIAIIFPALAIVQGNDVFLYRYPRGSEEPIILGAEEVFIGFSDFCELHWSPAVIVFPPAVI